MLPNNPLKYIGSLMILSLLYSCGYRSFPADQRQYTTESETRYEATPNILRQSLFTSKDRTISETDIQMILDSKVLMPDTIRIALLNYSSNSMSRYYDAYWSNEDYLKLQQEYIDILKKQLKEVAGVQKIILMPRIITGENPNIFTLRESAVRLQADLLYIFSINSDIYHKYKIFKKDQTKAYATCESLLMDIRTGIIPHSEVVTKDFLTQKSDEDIDNEELKKRTERTAVLLSLEEIGIRLAEFLN